MARSLFGILICRNIRDPTVVELEERRLSSTLFSATTRNKELKVDLSVSVSPNKRRDLLSL